MSIQDRAALVLQQIDAALALAEKATPGQGTFSTITPVAPVPRHYVRFGSSHVADVVGEGNAAFIAASRTLLPTSLRCLKTAIRTLLAVADIEIDESGKAEPAGLAASATLTAICDEWEAGR